MEPIKSALNCFFFLYIYREESTACMFRDLTPTLLWNTELRLNLVSLHLLASLPHAGVVTYTCCTYVSLFIPFIIWPKLQFCTTSSPTLLCIISDLNGSVYESVLPFRSSSTGAEGVQALSCSLCLSLPLGEEKLMSGAAVVLDEAHVAVIGFPHPSAGACKGDSSSSNLIIYSLH